MTPGQPDPFVRLVDLAFGLGLVGAVLWWLVG